MGDQARPADASGEIDGLLEIRVIPRARRDEVGGHREGRLVVRTTAAPTDGKANERVRRLIADHIGVAVSSVRIVSGEKSRDKRLRIDRGRR